MLSPFRHAEFSFAHVPVFLVSPRILTEHTSAVVELIVPRNRELQIHVEEE